MNWAREGSSRSYKMFLDKPLIRSPEFQSYALITCWRDVVAPTWGPFERMGFAFFGTRAALLAQCVHHWVREEEQDSPRLWVSHYQALIKVAKDTHNIGHEFPVENSHSDTTVIGGSITSSDRMLECDKGIRWEKAPFNIFSPSFELLSQASCNLTHYCWLAFNLHCLNICQPSKKFSVFVIVFCMVWEEQELFQVKSNGFASRFVQSF